MGMTAENKMIDVLIIDDEQVVLDSATKILSMEDFSADTALDAETALAKMEHTTYGVVLTDLMMPRISGFAVLESVQQKHPQTPVVVVTGFATLDIAVQALRSGAFDFLPKPFDIEEMLSIVTRALKYGGKMPADVTHRPLHFLGRHSWVDIEAENSARVGIGDVFLSIAENIQSVEFPEHMEEIRQGGACVRLITTDHLIHTMWSPISGRVIDVNHKVRENPELLNQSPFDEGWLVRMIPLNLERELENLVIRGAGAAGS